MTNIIGKILINPPAPKNALLAIASRAFPGVRGSFGMCIYTRAAVIGTQVAIIYAHVHNAMIQLHTGHKSQTLTGS